MKKIFFICIMLSIIYGNTLIASNSCTDYTYIPPTFSATVPPTVMIALDVSGSMAWDAYIEDYDSSKIYEGFFDPEKNYLFDDGVWKGTSGNASTCPVPYEFDESTKYCRKLWRYETNAACLNKNNIYSGSCLNYWIMTRIDAYRWAMTGGIPKGCTGNNNNKCDAERACSGDSCVIVTELNTEIELPLYDNDTNTPHGILNGVLYELKKKETRPRIGIMEFAGNKGIPTNSPKVYVGDFTNANSVEDEFPFSNVITAINTATIGGGTPSGPAMWDVWNHYLQNEPQYGGLEPDTGADESNHFKDPLYICNNNSGGLKCEFAPCSSNYVILASDGQWNTPSTYHNNYDSNDNSPDPVQPAHKMHLGATRSKDSVFVKIDAVYSLAMFLGGTGEKALKNVAMYGSFNKEKAGSNWPGGTSGYPDDFCRMDDGGNGSGSGCEDLPPSHIDWDTNNDSVPDTFYKAENALELKEKLTAIFDDIIKRANSGTAIATVSTEKRETSLLYQAYYYPQFEDNNTTINWIGNIRTYFIDDKDNIRNDEDNDKHLKLKSDKILLFKFIDALGETRGFKIADDDGDMIPDMCTLPPNDESYSLQTLNPIWSAAETLKSTNASNRKIYVNTSCNNNCNISLTDNFNNSNSTLVNSIASVWGTTASNAEKLINFIRGVDYDDTRSRNTGNGVYKLGDIINSTPVILKNEQVSAYDFIYNDYSYKQFNDSDTVKSRKNVLFVGANDGMVHAFAAGKLKEVDDSNDVAEVIADNGTSLGEEIWAFIPKNSLPYLQWYFEENNTCHVPKVDYRFMLVDASIGDESNKKDSWRTLLIGMMGFGGKKIITDTTYSSSIFAIDVTEPSSPKLLWEYQLPDNTLTLSFPSVVRLGNPVDKGSWYVTIGSGPLNPGATDFLTNSNKAKVYFINLKTGDKVSEIDVGKDVAISDIESLDIDHDYQVDLITLGTYSSPGTSIGKLYGIFLKDGNGGYKNIDNNLSLYEIVNVERPIFAKINNTIDDSYKLWLYFNTGRFLSNDDKIDNSTQYIIGIKDKNNKWKNPSNTFNPSFPNDFYNATETEVSASIKTVECYCLGIHCGEASYDTANHIYTCQKGSPVITETSGALISDTSFFCDNMSVDGCANKIANNGYFGWYKKLTNGERAYSQPFLAGGILDVLSFKPNSDLCAYGGDTFLNAMYYKTGTPGEQPMFLDSNDQNSNELPVNEPDNPVVKIVTKKFIGKGAPPVGEGITSLPASDDEYTKLIQTSVGSIIKQKQKAEDTTSKLLFKILR